MPKKKSPSRKPQTNATPAAVGARIYEVRTPLQTLRIVELAWTILAKKDDTLASLFDRHEEVALERAGLSRRDWNAAKVHRLMIRNGRRALHLGQTDSAAAILHNLAVRAAQLDARVHAPAIEALNTSERGRAGGLKSRRNARAKNDERIRKMEKLVAARGGKEINRAAREVLQQESEERDEKQLQNDAKSLTRRYREHQKSGGK